MQAATTLIERQLARLDIIAKEASRYVSALDDKLWDLNDPVKGPRLLRTYQPFPLLSRMHEDGLEAIIGISEGPSYMQSRSRKGCPEIKLRVRTGTPADETFRGWMDMLTGISPEYHRRLKIDSLMVEGAWPSSSTFVPNAEHGVWTLACDLIKAPEF